MASSSAARGSSSGILSVSTILRYAKLPSSLGWPTLGATTLFIRNSYDKLWEIILELFQKYQHAELGIQIMRVLLLGTTGIGKTAALNYFLIRALKTGIKVLFESREYRYFFSDGTVLKSDVLFGGLSEHRHDRSVLLLIDHQINCSPPICSAFTVAPMSPDPLYYKEFEKNDCCTLWMPLTTEAEIIAMNKCSDSPMDAMELTRRIELFGPIPRQVFKHDRETTTRTLASTCNQTS